MQTFRIALTMIILAALCGCNVDLNGPDSDTVESKEEKYTYQFDDNGCKTGKHSFDTLEALCRGLENNDLNNGCAVDFREREFVANECPGDFLPF